MPEIIPAVSCNLDRDLLATCLPLFTTGEIGGIEWSFDTLTQVREIPEWFTELLREFGNAGRLIGHGVFFSIFSGQWTPDHDQWLRHLEKVTRNFHFDHISEHFGFMTGPNFHQGAPMWVPLTPTTLAIGQDRLKRIAQASGRPVGLENLAFANSPEQALAQGSFLRELIEPVNGFLILDLHNLYCQVENFQLPAGEILSGFPLERVREIHVSGGSWEAVPALPDRKIRRDTHDDRVPDPVFDLLTYVIPLCPNLRFVVLEQMGTALKTAPQKEGFRADFKCMKGCIHSSESTRQPATLDFSPPDFQLQTPPIASEALQQEQLALSDVLENAGNYDEAIESLTSQEGLPGYWEVEKWSPWMVETAMQIARKWKQGW